SLHDALPISFAQKPHATQKLFTSIKEDDSRLCSYAPDIAVNERICQRLVNAPEAILGKSFSQMAVEFPIPCMADKRDPSRVAMILGHVCCDPLPDLLVCHCRRFQPGKKICAEQPKVTAVQLA